MGWIMEALAADGDQSQQSGVHLEYFYEIWSKYLMYISFSIGVRLLHLLLSYCPAIFKTIPSCHFPLFT